jgi:glycosyltransferase involved in cell wall biosynthesis
MLKKIYINRFTIFVFRLFIQLNFIIILKVYCKYLFCKTVLIKRKNHSDFISIINTHDQSGGASNIAFDLCAKLKDNYNIRFFVKFKKREFNWINEIKINKYNLIESLLNEEAKKKGWINFAGFDAINLLNENHFNKSNIVHLHNLHENFLSPAIFSVLFENKKIIWTLHDEFVNTGHCGFSMNCNKWLKGCGECPDLSIYPSVKFDNTENVLKNKKKWINKNQPYIITPSEWLEKRVRLIYPKLKNIKTIKNGIDTKIYFPKNKLETKKKLNLPIDKKLILFVAEYATNNPFKGGNILREIIKNNKNDLFTFITVGGKHENILKNHISIPYISNKEELANLYNACDVLLYPTQADNLPLVVLESMACGTPVIASRLGGIPEIISDHEDGFLINDFKNEKEFIEVLNNYINLTKEQQENIEINATKKINNYFSLDKMAANYLKLYKEVSA